MHRAGNDTSRGYAGIVAGLIIAVSALHLAPLLWPEVRLWGVNHLLFLPVEFVALFALLCLFAFIMFFGPRKLSGEKSFDLLARALFDNNRLLLWLIIAAFSLLPFWLLRMKTFFYGDGYYLINNLSHAIPTVFKWSEAAAVWIISRISLLTDFADSRKGEYAYAVVSAVSGATSIFFVSRIARLLYDDPRIRLLMIGLFLTGGWILLFFGYVENYPILWPFMTGYIFYALRYLSGRGTIIPPVLLILIATALHLQAVFFLPSLLPLLFARGAGERLWQKRQHLLIMLGAAILCGGTALIIYYYQTVLEFRIHFLSPFSGRPARPDYAMFSPKHIGDILNYFTLLIPLWLVLVLLGWRKLRHAVCDKTGYFLVTLTGCGLLFLLIIDPKFGMARDWDLYALAGLGPLLILLRAESFSPLPHFRLYPGLVILSAAMTMPFVAAGVGYDASITHYKYLLRLDPESSRVGLIVLRSFYYDKGDSATGDAIDREIFEKFRAIRLIRLATELSRSGQTDKALEIADSVFAIDPYASEAHNLRGMIYLRAGDYPAAIRDLDQASRIGQYDARIAVNLAQAYMLTGEREKMMATLRYAQRLRPHMIFVNEALSTAYLGQQKFDSAFAYAKIMVKNDSGFAGGYKLAGMAAIRMGDTAAALPFLDKFLRLAPNDVEANAVQQLLDIDRRQKSP